MSKADSQPELRRGPVLWRKMLRTTEVEIFLAGLGSIGLLLLVIFITRDWSTRVSNALLAMTGAHVLGGRAAGIAAGFEGGLPTWIVIAVSMVVETSMVLILFPVFVLSYNGLFVIKPLKTTLENAKRTAVRHHKQVVRYGIPGLLIFVFFPFWMTGPLVGCIIGYLMGLRNSVNLTVVLSGTYLAIFCWGKLMKGLHERLKVIGPWAPMALVGLLILLSTMPSRGGGDATKAAWAWIDLARSGRSTETRCTMARKQRPIPTLPFRHFLSYSETESFLKQLAAARPGFASLGSLGKSREGRDIYCLTVTNPKTGPAEDKPAYLIHGNIHAAELSGTHAALFTARQLLADYPLRTKVPDRVAFHIVPRLNPDGAEVVVTTSASVRSRRERTRVAANTLVHKDMDGDGLVLQMRRERPDGDMMPDPKDRRLLIPRKPGAKGPFYKVYPEGEIVNWDGSDNIIGDGRVIDWNRQWSFDWKPEPEQAGSGDFPYSEPEMRSIALFIQSRSNLFGVMGYHTGPAALLRPPSGGSDADLDEKDLRKIEEIAQIGAKRTGLPVVPVCRYCPKRARNISLRGHFHSTGYRHFGLFVYEFELGTIMDSAGIGFEEWSSWETPEQREAGERRLMRWWDRRGRKPKIFAPWRRFEHPQLGRVEIGGRVLRECAGMTMPDLKKRCAGTYRFTLDHAAMHPRVVLEEVKAEKVAPGVHRIRATVANRGQLPTNVSNRGAKLKRLKQVRVEFTPGRGVSLLSQQAHYDLGHMTGPGGGRPLEWFVRARKGATCRIAVHGGTGGNVREEIALSP